MFFKGKLKEKLFKLVLFSCCILLSCKRQNDNPQSNMPIFAGRKLIFCLQNEYATVFNIYEYEDGIYYITTQDNLSYAIIPNNIDVSDFPKDCTVIRQGSKNIYMAASSVMALWFEVEDASNIRFSSIKQNNLYSEKAINAMQEETMIFAGKYNAPDYELLLNENCELAVESTMIFHKIEVKEKLEALGIPVFVDMSSYETNPLGRIEWIKVYGVITGHLREACDFFEEQKQLVLNLNINDSVEKKFVAYFYINSSGLAVIRRSSDYIPNMINMAGGIYLGEDDINLSSPVMTISIEELYKIAKDADIIIYNGTFGKESNSVATIQTLNDLISLNALFSDFKAVKNKNVWLIDGAVFQATDKLSLLIADMNRVFTSNKSVKTQFLQRVPFDE